MSTPTLHPTATVSRAQARILDVLAQVNRQRHPVGIDLERLAGRLGYRTPAAATFVGSTCALLEQRGLVAVSGVRWSITEEGRQVLAHHNTMAALSTAVRAAARAVQR